MRSLIQIVVRACIIALSFTLEAPSTASSQTSEIPRDSVVEPKEATVRFVKLFDETCFQHRHALNELREGAGKQGWREMPGPFPYHNAEERSTTLIAWGLWLEGVPYQVALIAFEEGAPAVTCTVMSAVINKASLPDKMLKISGLSVREKLHLRDNNATLFDTAGEKQLRIACFTPVQEKVMIGQCALAVAEPSKHSP